MNVSKYCTDPRKEGEALGEEYPKDGLSHDNGRKRHPKGRIYIIIILILFIGAGALTLPLLTKCAAHDALIRVPKGASKQMLVDTITKYLGYDYAESVSKALPIVGGGAELRHGAWRIEKDMTAFSAARRICKEGQAGIRVTFLNERTPRQVAEKIASKLDVPVDSMMAVFSNDSLLGEMRTDRNNVIGLFMADTYEFYWTATPQEIIGKMRDHYNRFWTNERLAHAEALHLLPREIVVLASIVDEETNQDSEKGMIARLYLNRLQNGMKLQADPTVKYALGDFSIQRITHDMLSCDNRYNTYLYEGLPPGPIRITSGATIDAILTSRPHNYMYMCASPDFSGKHNFAVNYESHMENARRYQKALDERGIK